MTQRDLDQQIKSIELVLELKFGEECRDLMSRVRQMNDIDKLRAIQRSLREARTLEEIAPLVDE